MKIPYFFMSLSVVCAIGLGPGFASGAQLLSDEQLDEVSASGSFEFQILPPDALLPIANTQALPSQNTAIDAAKAAVNAAAAAADSALAVKGLSGLSVATGALDTANEAVKAVGVANGISAINAGTKSLDAAAKILQAVPQDKLTPQIIEATGKIHNAALAMNQAGYDAGAIHLNAAAEAVKAASHALDSIPKLEGGDGHFNAAFQATVDSIAAAKKAIEFVANHEKTLSTNNSGGTNPADPKFVENLGNAPIVRFSYDGGHTSAAGEVIPVGAASPQPPGFNVNGDAIFSGNAFQVQNMIMNINVCNHCRAGGDIIQSGNGYVFPIYTK